MSEGIPEGWSVSPLGDIADIRFSNVDKKSDFDNELPVKLCNYMDVYSNREITNNLPFMQATAKEREIEKFRLQKDDVIITKDSETPDDIAVSAYVSEELRNVICGYHLAMLRPEHSVVDGEYLSQLFGLHSVQHYFYLLANGITRFGLTSDAINNASIVYPPKPEQQIIASILASVDEVIEKTESQISKLQDLKKGMMQELLTKGIGHTEFKDSPVGRIPKEWDVVAVSELAASSRNSFVIGPFGSNLVMADYTLDGVPVVFVRDIKPNRFNWISNVFVSEEKAKELSAHNVYPNDIVITKMGMPPGIAAIYSSTMPTGIVTADIIRLRVDSIKAVPEFLVEVLNGDSAAKQVRDRTAGQTRPKLTLSDYKTVVVALPKKDEQEEIAEILSSVSGRIEKKEKQQTLFHSLKKALMQDLLTGRVRVNG